MKILGEDHPDTWKSLSDLSISYCIIGDEEKYKELTEKIYQNSVKNLGEDHPDTR